MTKESENENPTETSGTVAGRAAGVSPPSQDKSASPGAEADKKQAEKQKI